MHVWLLVSTNNVYIFSTNITYVFYQIIVGIFITFLSHGAVLCVYVCIKF